MRRMVLVIFVSSLISILRAENSLPVGNWVRRANNGGVNATLIIEVAGAGRKLTFKAEVAGGVTTTLIVTTLLDGKDAPVSVDGKPSDQTMAMHMVDDRHAINVLKMNGNPIATQKSEISADGKVIKVESSPMAPGARNSIEYWDKK